MKRAILVALGVGAIVSSAAAFSVGAGGEAGASLTQDRYLAKLRLIEVSRASQRARIEARYQAERAQCAALGGVKRDTCMVQVHATRGRAMLDAAAPYEVRL